MHIAIVSDYYFDYVGGAQTSMRQQKRALEEAGHTVLVVSPARGVLGARYQLTSYGMQVKPLVRVPGLDLGVIPSNERTVAALTNFFRAERIDVVHVQTEFGLAHAAGKAAAALGLPLVHTVHSFYWESERIPQAATAWFTRAMLRLIIGKDLPDLVLTARAADNVLRNLTLEMAMSADQVVSPSAHQARDLRTAGVRRPVSVVPNPIATADDASQPLTMDDVATPHFVWVARCESVKRPLPFARAVVEALDRTDNGFTVDFVGEGAELGALKRIVAGHPEVRVQGALSHVEVLELMDSASAVVLTSFGFDNQPMTIAEAVSRERGVLYCDPKLREGLKNSGYLAETPDDAGLADALVALVTDPQLLVALSHGATKDRTLFSPERYVELISKVYAEAPSAVAR
jgi:glycosyltransferase involved in cell wall biosynthesis